MYSFGIVIWELLTGKELYSDLTYILNHKPPSSRSSPSDVLQSFFSRDPSNPVLFMHFPHMMWRWHCEQHTATWSARGMWAMVEVAHGAVLVQWTIREANLHRDRKEAGCSSLVASAPTEVWRRRCRSWTILAIKFIHPDLICMAPDGWWKILYLAGVICFLWNKGRGKRIFCKAFQHEIVWLI